MHKKTNAVIWAPTGAPLTLKNPKEYIKIML